MFQWLPPPAPVCLDMRSVQAPPSGVASAGSVQVDPGSRLLAGGRLGLDSTLAGTVWSPGPHLPSRHFSVPVMNLDLSGPLPGVCGPGCLPRQGKAQSSSPGRRGGKEDRHREGGEEEKGGNDTERHSQEPVSRAAKEGQCLLHLPGQSCVAWQKRSACSQVCRLHKSSRLSCHSLFQQIYTEHLASGVTAAHGADRTPGLFRLYSQKVYLVFYVYVMYFMYITLYVLCTLDSEKY